MAVTLSTANRFLDICWYVCSEGAFSAAWSSPTSTDSWRQFWRGTNDRNAYWRDYTSML